MWPVIPPCEQIGFFPLYDDAAAAKDGDDGDEIELKAMDSEDLLGGPIPMVLCLSS